MEQKNFRSDHSTFAEVSREYGVCVQSVHRWRLTGILAPDGTRRRLNGFKFGGRWFVKKADLDAFILALNSQSRPGATAPPTKNLAHERAEHECELIGL